MAQEVALQGSCLIRNHVLSTCTVMVMLKNCKVTKDALDSTFEVSKLVKFSPKQSAQLEKLRNELAIESPGFHVLCLSHWTVNTALLKSVLTNCKTLQQLWETMKDS